MAERDDSKWAHIGWTPAMDAIVLRGLETRTAYNRIAKQLGVSWNAIARRVRVLKADGKFRTEPLKRRIASGIVPPEYAARVAPLPPGHPTTWDAITNGTMLEGVAYPGYKGDSEYG